MTTEDEAWKWVMYWLKGGHTVLQLDMARPYLQRLSEEHLSDVKAILYSSVGHAYRDHVELARLQAIVEKI